MSIFLALDISLPFRFAFINVSPSHRIRLYVRENAMPLKASDAIRGSPSPWKVFAKMPKQATESVKRLQVSTLLRVESMLTQGLIVSFMMEDQARNRGDWIFPVKPHVFKSDGAATSSMYYTVY